MKSWNGYARGMGIGGWLTNYKRFHVLPMDQRMRITIGDLEHFDSYITQWDVENIASMGMDHIRLCFDQLVVEETPYHYRESAMAKLEQFAGWCREAGLCVMLNLHKCIGNYCDVEEPVKLFESQELQNRLIALWLELERRFHGEEQMAFELLNEVKNLDPRLWNDLAGRIVKELRALNPRRKIVIGSTCWNSVSTLKDLALFEDENIGYTFHFYEPFSFTHQRGVLQSSTLLYNRGMPYPGDIERYRDYCRFYGQSDPLPQYDRMDRRFLYDQLGPVDRFLAEHPDKLLYCGEFGTIRHCRLEWRENWMRDVIGYLVDRGIPYSVWNYLSTPNDGNRFSLVDDDSRTILSPSLLEILQGKV